MPVHASKISTRQVSKTSGSPAKHAAPIDDEIIFQQQQQISVHNFRKSEGCMNKQQPPIAWEVIIFFTQH